MATEVVMPRLSDTMDSGTIAKWLKNEGDPVKAGEVIAEIETDKSNMELESYANGVIAQILVKEGQSATLGAPIATIAANAEEAQKLQQGGDGSTAGSSGEDTAPTATSSQAESPKATSNGTNAPQRAAEPTSDREATPQSEPATATSNERIKASPLAKRLAQENGINLADLSGTGPGGRITKEDVQAFMRQRESAAPAAAQPVPEQPAAAAQPSEQQHVTGQGVRDAHPVDMSRMQQTIARRMTESRFSKPEFVLTAEYDMTEARALLKSISGVEGAPKVGPNDLLIKAVALALKQHPEVNAGWENDGMVQYGRINIGVAVAIPGGLVVPVIRDAATKTLGQVAAETKGLIEKARNNKLVPAEYEAGTFTISNLGMYGIDQFTPILNAPEACIMGVGAMAPKPVVVDGEVVVRDRMRIDLACDHRVVNGSQGAEFLQTLRRYLEHPMLAIL